MPERFPYNKESAFFVYDRIMNLLKHFSKGLDSTGKFGYNGLSTQEQGVLNKQSERKRRQAL